VASWCLVGDAANNVGTTRQCEELGEGGHRARVEAERCRGEGDVVHTALDKSFGTARRLSNDNNQLRAELRELRALREQQEAQRKKECDPILASIQTLQPWLESSRQHAVAAREARSTGFAGLLTSVTELSRLDDVSSGHEVSSDLRNLLGAARNMLSVRLEECDELVRLDAADSRHSPSDVLHDATLTARATPASQHLILNVRPTGYEGQVGREPRFPASP